MIFVVTMCLGKAPMAFTTSARWTKPIGDT